MKYKKGGKWIDKGQCEKIEMYENNLKLYRGKHYEVFEKSAIARIKKSGYDINSKGTFLMYNYQNVHMPVATEVSLKEIFVSENVLGLSTKVFRNFLFGEDPVITNEDEIQTAWINEVINNNDMHSIYQRGLIYQCVCGFAAIKTSLVIDEKQGNKIKFSLYENENIKIKEKDNEKEEIDNIQIMYTTKEKTEYSMNEQDEQEILHVETHYKDRIEYNTYIVDKDTILATYPLPQGQPAIEIPNP